MTGHARSIVACLTLAAPLCAAAADESDLLINSLLDGVSEDADRAVKLVAAAAQLGANEKLAVKILARAADFAVRAAAKPAAYQAGIDALDQLDKKAPADKARWQRKRLDLCRGAYRAAPDATRCAAGVGLMKALDAAGDAAAKAGKWREAGLTFTEAQRIAAVTMRRRQYFHQKQRWAAHFQTAERKIAGIKSSAADGGDEARFRQRMLEVYLIDLDDPDQAGKQIAAETGQIWRTYVPMAARKIEQLPENACRELSDWYVKVLANRASPTAKLLMLRRAERYCRRAVKLHTAKDVGLMQLHRRLVVIEDALRKLQPMGEALARVRQVDLLRLVDLDLDATAGGWVAVKGAARSSNRAPGTLRFPVDANGSYRLSFSIAKTQGARDVIFTFPVDDREVTLRLHEYYASKYGTSSSSYSISSHSAVTWLRLGLSGTGRKPTQKAMEINPRYNVRNWVPYTVDVTVDSSGSTVRLGVSLNRRKWLSWSGTKASLPARSDPSVSPVSVAFTKPGVGISAAKLRLNGGTVRYSRGSPADEASAEVTAIESGRRLPDWADPLAGETPAAPSTAPAAATSTAPAR